MSLKTITKDLLKKLEITPEKISVTKTDQEIFNINIKLKEADSGILIGYHGDTLSALQLMIGLIAYKESGSWTRAILNIGDYRQKREESLKVLAQDTAQRVKFSNEPIALFNLNPFERRTVHLILESDKDIITESEGEGKNRHLIVKPKNPTVNTPPLPTEDDQPTS
ncbi:MAG: KH domain-containing protein [Patescibacteria group bacterium]|nr:KH domain-containing protein [Patescibacteria group bacterium]